MTQDKEKFRISGLSDYSKESIINEIRRVQKLLGKELLTNAEFMEHSRVGRNTVLRKLGSWPDALAATGVSQSYYGNLAHGEDGLAARGLTNEEILEKIRLLDKKLNKGMVTREDVRREIDVPEQAFVRRFGSVTKAIKAAGVPTSPAANRYSDQECFENLLKVWTHYGRQPKARDLNRPPSNVGLKAYLARFGSWMRAIESFVEKANEASDDPPIVSQIDGGSDRLPAEAETVDATAPANRRDIPLGQRFRILRRDNFKCILCGNSPAVDPTCVLHVDHILPFSRGGKTVDDNLRSTCAQCNIGRSNRYSD